MNNIADNLISTLIKKTKDGTLRWAPYSSSNLKPEKMHRNNMSFVDDIDGYAIEPDNSYCASYHEGEFFLLASSRLGDLSTSRISLSVQTATSMYSIEYASTTDGSPLAQSELKRLYNIVDSLDYDVSSFIENFLKS